MYFCNEQYIYLCQSSGLIGNTLNSSAMCNAVLGSCVIKMGITDVSDITLMINTVSWKSGMCKQGRKVSPCNDAYLKVY